MELYKEVKNVKTKDDFIKFIGQLGEDFLANAEEWENKSISEYLSGMMSWVEDMEGYYINNKLEVPQNIDWNFFANVLFAGRIYE